MRTLSHLSRRPDHGRRGGGRRDIGSRLKAGGDRLRVFARSMMLLLAGEPERFRLLLQRPMTRFMVFLTRVMV